MAITEVRLESKLVPFAELVLRHLNVDVEFDSILAQDGERSLGEEEVRMVTAPQASTFWSRASAWIRNMFQILALAPAMCKAMAWERQCFGNIPWNVTKLDSWALQQFDCIPTIFSRVPDAALKRTFALGLREVFAKDQSTKWSKFQKVAFMYVFAKGMHNQQLERDAVTMTMGSEKEATEKTFLNSSSDSCSTTVRNEEMHSIASTKLDHGLQSVFLEASKKAEPHSAFSAATKYVYACAGRANRVPERVKRGLLEQVTDPRSILDLAGMIAFFSFMHRVSTLVPPS